MAAVTTQRDSDGAWTTRTAHKQGMRDSGHQLGTLSSQALHHPEGVGICVLSGYVTVHMSWGV